MKLRIGDKVKIADTELNKKYKGKIGTITDTDRIKNGFSNRWDYEVGFDNESLEDYVFCPEELEKILAKNEQLLFKFMESEDYDR